MKEYICRLVNYDGIILDDAFVAAKNKKRSVTKVFDYAPIR